MPHDLEWMKNWKPPLIRHGEFTLWNWLVLNPENLHLGWFTDIGAFTLIVAKYGVWVEEGVEIGSHCAIYSESTIDEQRGPVTIRKGARIGSHTTVMPNVEIGEGAVIGAHSFVKKSVPPGATAFGVPAKVQN